MAFGVYAFNFNRVGCDTIGVNTSGIRPDNYRPDRAPEAMWVPTEGPKTVEKGEENAL